MLAVSKAASPYAALSPESTARTAADTRAPDGTPTLAIALPSSASRSTAGSVTDASLPAPAGEATGGAADDTAAGPGRARAFTQAVPPAVTPPAATTAGAAYSSGRRRGGRARRPRRAPEDSMAAMLGARTVRRVGRA
ncbi:hypothetical protein GCM10010260_33490 [Streptomyces filipinensis]|uniref:Uncharacterized protein n=1 Tax=Streptomyces filipinensis TaxID=66887 RepID=A0A918IAQ3_9ACTN|nr:hypothetical protein GCM10010260_33490 [Streptomyces filipinensis]